MNQTMDLYTDYLISNLGLATSTKGHQILGISEDKLNRFLGGIQLFTKDTVVFVDEKSGESTLKKKGLVKEHISLDNADLWKLVKKEVRESEEIEPATLIVDDTLIHKPYSDENDIVCYHFDHVSGQSIKGINLLNGGLYYKNQDKYIPIFANIVAKTEKVLEEKKDKNGEVKIIEKRKANITKNEIFRQEFNHIMQNHIKLDYTVFDIWFGSIDNLNFIHKHKQTYICPLKSNRKLALSMNEKKQGKWYKLEEITGKLDTQETLPIWLESSTHMSYLTKQTFTNKDGSEVTMYLITNDSNLTKNQIHQIYQRRWKVEEFHKSLKSNLSLEKSPTKNKVSQNNHIICSIVAFFKLELLTKTSHFKNHFQFKQSILLKALQVSYQELGRLRLEAGCGR